MQEIDLNQFKKNLKKEAPVQRMSSIRQGGEETTWTDLLQKDIRFPWQNQLKEKYKESFYYELGTLVQAGVDVKHALEIICSSIKDRHYLRLMERLRTQLIAGLSLSESMNESGEFSEYELACIRIGEETGRVEEIVTELSLFFGKKIKNKRKLISSLSYPLIVLSTAFSAVFFMLQVVVPMFSDVFKQFGGQLPWLTQQVVKLSDMIKRDGTWILLLLILSLVALFYFRRSEQLRKVRSRIILRIPLLGDLVLKIYLARMCSSLSLLVGNAVPLVSSIAMVRKMINFYPFEQSLLVVEEEIIKGTTFHESLQKFPIYPNRLVQLIKVGEEVNEMENLLKKVAEQYNEEVEFKVQTVSGIIEPLLIVFLGLIVGLILVAMYLPMFQISNSF